MSSDSVVRDHHRAVDVPVPQVPDRPVGVLAAAWPSAAPSGSRCRPNACPETLDDLPEERIAGHPIVRFRDDNATAVRPMGHQRPGRPVRGEAQALHGGVHGGLRVRTDPAAAVDRAGRSRPGDPGRRGNIFQGRRTARWALLAVTSPGEHRARTRKLSSVLTRMV